MVCDGYACYLSKIYFSATKSTNIHSSRTVVALVAFEKQVANWDGFILNLCEQDVDPSSGKGVRCDSRSKRVINL